MGFGVLTFRSKFLDIVLANLSYGINPFCSVVLDLCTKAIEALKEKGLEASTSYVENLSESIFTYVEFLVEKGEVIAGTTGVVERSMREIGRRVKKVGGSWTDKGALKLIKLLRKRIFEGDELKRFWKGESQAKGELPDSPRKYVQNLGDTAKDLLKYRP